ncbi:Cof-type HAD-IIB family hydrolase [Schleiferilactobacillus shenzhenensis]|uniref:Phosphoglycolate phosphatase n=1 Tax=Schleiferilactobacillus shenzhenensis LY-73 TaxID=1231336 RepID=U4TPU6_9LACO|nr:Cof-type HAD-IIB family hydrolase [Schleiferilactobacillus shenzhenensis]ERL66244.1 Phosphoglycolate phosphatase [Schleiferilactobacillus shenzhenensis LY-73]
MLKMIASDMDGTLLNDKMTVSPGNIAAIQEANQAGIEFVVATGRGLTEAQPLVSDLTVKPAFITLNGARVFSETGELLVDLPIPRALIGRLRKDLEAQGYYYELVTNRGIFSQSKVRRIQNVADLLTSLNPDTSFKIAVVLASARLELMDIHYIDTFDSLLVDPTVEVLKMLVFDGRGQSAFAPIRDAYGEKDGLVITSSSPNNIEINSIEAQKGLALARLARMRGYDLADVMAIGDNLNDRSMIETAGIGVAMGNAIPEIRQIAQYITTTNIKDGVAQAIRWGMAQPAQPTAEH